MKNLSLTVLLLGILSTLPCCNIDNCGGESKPYFDIRSLSARNIIMSDFAFNNSLIQYQNLDSTTAVDPLRFGVELVAEVTFHAEAGTTQYPFAGVAFACDPKPFGYNGSREKISGIIISSETDFDSLHLAGSSLNEYFSVSTLNKQGYSNGDSLAHKTIPLINFLSNPQEARSSLQLWLTKNPRLSKQHRFTIKYTQTNGEEYNLQAPLAIFH